MAQYVMNAYDADVYISQFLGLMQYGDQMQSDIRYSSEAVNCETIGGVLQPAYPLHGTRLVFTRNNVEIPAVTSGTLMYMREDQSGIPQMSQSDYSLRAGMSAPINISPSSRSGINKGYDRYLFAAGGSIYTVGIAGDPREHGNYTMAPVPFNSDSDRPGLSGLFSTDRWSWCTYEKTEGEEGQIPRTYRILMMSNPIDGVWMYKDGKLYKVDTPSKFSWIEMYADRLWGCGAEKSEDRMYYSRPYDPTDWTQDNDDPANGGGEIREPTWEKDRFVALKKLGDNLIAFTKKRAWKISGTDPTTFSIQEQLGAGCLYPDTIAVMNSYILMLGENSLVTYDGYKVSPYMQNATRELFKKIGENEYIRPVGVKIGERYLLSMANEIGDALTDDYGETFTKLVNRLKPDDPVEMSAGSGYFTLVYNTTDGTINVMETPQILSFCELAPYAMTYEPETTDGETTIPARNRLCPVGFDSWERQRITDRKVRWVSPWITFGRQDIKKGGFDLYFTPEIRPRKDITGQLWSENSVNGWDVPSILQEEETEGPVTFTFSIQTEKKTKTKQYTVQPLTAEQKEAGKKHKPKRLHFGGSGRRFRLIIECQSGYPWRLIGGIHIIAETDKD